MSAWRLDGVTIVFETVGVDQIARADSTIGAIRVVILSDGISKDSKGFALPNSVHILLSDISQGFQRNMLLETVNMASILVPEKIARMYRPLP